MKHDNSLVIGQTCTIIRQLAEMEVLLLMRRFLPVDPQPSSLDLPGGIDDDGDFEVRIANLKERVQKHVNDLADSDREQMLEISAEIRVAMECLKAIRHLEVLLSQR
ncbi:MAG: hypothetical protein HND43_09060 [Armatimonadetes bacterium]|nr:hypothetical protein [Armatimonadota bacterium]